MVSVQMVLIEQGKAWNFSPEVLGGWGDEQRLKGTEHTWLPEGRNAKALSRDHAPQKTEVSVVLEPSV